MSTENTYEASDTSASYQVSNDDSFAYSDDNQQVQEEETPVEDNEEQSLSDDSDYTNQEEDANLDLDEDDTPSSDRPEWLPENFNSPEDMAKSYKELQGEFTKIKQQMASQKYSEKSKQELQVKEGNQKAAEQSTSLEFDSAFDEFFDTGSLSEATLQKYSQKGITPDQLHSIMLGKQAQVTQMQNSIYEAAGGKEQYNDLVSWASDNLSEGDKKVFNDAIQAGKEYAEFAVKALALRRAESTGNEPKLVSSNESKRTQTNQGFKNDHEMLKAMNDPRYESDPEYRRNVERRIARSSYSSSY